MPYELVSTADEERGYLFADLDTAIAHAKESGCEVWALADDDANTRMKREWPEPTDAEIAAATIASRWRPAAAEAARRWKSGVDQEEQVKRFVHDNIGRAEREATAILAEYAPVSPDQVHAIVTLAWGRGFMAGFGTGTETFADLLNRVSDGIRR